MNIENKNLLNIIFLGPPGSGKGTQSDLLKDYLGIPHISTGDLIRHIIAQESELSREVRSYLNEGKLVPDQLMIRILSNHLVECNIDSGLILDGFPRTLDQAKALEESTILRLRIDHVFYFDIDSDLLFKRLTGRRIAKNSGKVYNIYFNPPKTPNVCDVSGEPLVQRTDDAEDTVKTRLKVYDEETKPLIQFYEDKGLLRKVNVNDSIENIFNSIKKVLGV